MNIVKYTIISAIVLLGASLVGCSERLNLREVTTKAISATCEAQSYRISEVATYTLEGESGVSITESEFTAPDRYHDIISSAGGWGEYIFIGDRGFVRDSKDISEWCELPCQYDDPSSGATGMITATATPLDKKLEYLNWLVDLKKLANEEIDGVVCLHYRGRLDVDSYVNMLRNRVVMEYEQFPSDISTWEVNFELWVEKDTHLIRQLKSEEHVMVDNPDTGEKNLFSGSTTKQFYDFNEPINIELPQM
ncbi:MAG: hypothetical protein HWN70_12230 [Desulfobacterales bacterium]|nr:hypothetical protein [Desulfobacterales bacterium]